ncbi:S-methyl-5-thioribose-1-phosphate isomerase [Ectothiorhodospiraceae bacterium BW-2]|nr:S-methyl-5-thioribose-1-phosphate isomerase [Ectothiorhodospiraceae bacterium BW-2]
MATVEPIRWHNRQLHLLDQRLLPQQIRYNSYDTALEVAAAITTMVVRGAPAIGVSAAYGVVLSAQQHGDNRDAIAADIAHLAKARPTAINLHWALQQMQQRLESGATIDELTAAAIQIHADDIAANRKMGELGAALIETPSTAVLTHCNAGALATGGYGTALGVVRRGYSDGKICQLYADETRPWLQGARLTAWEMVQEQIPVTLIAEGAAASLMQQGNIGWVIVGSDRIVANGDVANKIGTYPLAIIARHHGVKFMVVAPTSTIDMSLESGSQIPIEQRSSDELLTLAGQPMAALGAEGWNPVFDVTPAALIDAIVTEKGVVEQPNREKMARLFTAAPADTPLAAPANVLV